MHLCKSCDLVDTSRNRIPENSCYWGVFTGFTTSITHSALLTSAAHSRLSCVHGKKKKQWSNGSFCQQALTKAVSSQISQRISSRTRPGLKEPKPWKSISFQVSPVILSAMQICYSGCEENVAKKFCLSWLLHLEINWQTYVCCRLHVFAFCAAAVTFFARSQIRILRGWISQIFTSASRDLKKGKICKLIILSDILG